MRTLSTEIVDAVNQYMAAVAVAARHADDVTIVDVCPAVDARVSSTDGERNNDNEDREEHDAEESDTITATKRRPRSPEADTRVGQNVVKARVARTAKLTATKARGDGAAFEREDVQAPLSS